MKTGELTEEEIKKGLRTTYIKNEIVPCFVVQPLKIKACKQCWMLLLNISFASDVPAVKGHLDDAAETLTERHPTIMNHFQH